MGPINKEVMRDVNVVARFLHPPNGNATASIDTDCVRSNAGFAVRCQPPLCIITVVRLVGGLVDDWLRSGVPRYNRSLFVSLLNV